MDIEVTIKNLDGFIGKREKGKYPMESSIRLKLNVNLTLEELAEKILEKFGLSRGEDYGFYDSPNIDDSTIGFETLYDKYKKHAVYSLRDVRGVKHTKIEEILKMNLSEIYFLYDYSEMNVFKVEFNRQIAEQVRSEEGGELDYDTFMKLFSPIGENLINEFKNYFESLFRIAKKSPAGIFFGKEIGAWLYRVLNERPERLSVVLGRKIEDLLIDIADNELIFNIPSLYINFPVFKLSLLDLITDGDPIEIANNVLISTAYFKDTISTYGDKLSFATTLLQAETGLLPVLAVLRMLLEPKLFFKEPRYIDIEKEDNIDPVSLFAKELYNSNIREENLITLSVLYLVASIVSILDKHIGIKDTIIEAISNDEDLESFEDFLQVKINLDYLPLGSMEQKLLKLLIGGKIRDVTLYDFYTLLIKGLYMSLTGEELNVFKEEIDDAITILTDFMHQNLSMGVKNVMLDYLSKNYSSEVLEILKELQ